MRVFHRSSPCAAILACFLSLPGCSGAAKEPPDDHVRITIYMPANSEADKLDVLVNNAKIGVARRDESVLMSFPATPDGKNTIQFVAGKKSISQKEEFCAIAGAEINATITYIYRTIGDDTFDVSVRIVKNGDGPSIQDSFLEPEIIRREALREKVTGPPGTKYAVTRKRTVEREVTLSETAKLSLSGSVTLGFGLVDVAAKIKTTLAQKDTVLMRDKEEVTQTVSVDFDMSGSTTLVWVDSFKKGKATYKFNGRTKQLDFEVLYSSELSIARE